MSGKPDVHATSLQFGGPHRAGNLHVAPPPQEEAVLRGCGHGTEVGTSPDGVCESAITVAKKR